MKHDLRKIFAAAAAALLAAALTACNNKIEYYPLEDFEFPEETSVSSTTDAPAASAATTAEQTKTEPAASLTEEAKPAEDDSSQEEQPEHSDLPDGEYLRQSLFIGDSICSGLSTYLDDYIAGGNVLAYRDGRTTSMLSYSFDTGNGPMTADNAFAYKQPEFVYFWLGTNELTANSPEKFSENYRSLIEGVVGSEPDGQLKIGIVSIAPTGRNYSVPIETVSKLNEALQKLADDMGENVYFIDITQAVADESGYLKGEFDTGDGLHINQQGYRAISQALLSEKM